MESNRPARRYVIAGSQRSGSSLLCEGLEATGVAGHPAESFAPDFLDHWFHRWGLVPDCPFADYLAAARRHGTGRNGVFGIKIQYMHVQSLARWAGRPRAGDAVLERLFPGARYVNIVRRDVRAQALSFYRAIHTNQWARTPGVAPAPPPALDPREVEQLERQLTWQQTSWLQYFAARGIEPFTVYYESLAADYRGQIARVLEFLGLDGATARLLPPPVLIRQADETTRRWREALDGRSDGR
ncbi:Stf0 family sulfotransferase [Nannocystis punicea]|uniref:Stf0 family sulfotransferase n=1 Tax=Nannocystis punicea TaxID=2995304 RepID=A0ABY7H112_9BACT|nr:Stf0 family sulfotransferase [Nannocystis poenicansa]WAS92939.1 Stf0 family sulfotransferase [Nannocystis poenicansa]